MQGYGPCLFIPLLESLKKSILSNVIPLGGILLHGNYFKMKVNSVFFLVLVGDISIKFPFNIFVV